MRNFSSCIYTGLITHKRFKPKKHFFSYKAFSLFIDLNEIEDLNKKINFFSYNKFNILSFYNIDHGPRDGTSLNKWVKKNLIKAKINLKDGSIKLLCFPRFFGYVFNPLSIFYCYDKKSNLKAVLYEVKNTFNEQHTYVFKSNSKSNLITHKCRKKFYVSPFIKMKTFYNFRLSKPKKKIDILIKQTDFGGPLLMARQVGKRLRLNSYNLFYQFLKHPLMSFKVIGAIHFEAFRLWLKGVKLVKKKNKHKKQFILRKLMSLNYFADRFIFWNLKKIAYGNLELTDCKGNTYFFGNQNNPLKAKIKIIDPSFCYNILRKGSIALGESYMNGDFKTDDLTSLIELTARNINTTYKFSGFFEFSLLNSFLKENKNTIRKSKENISLHYDLGNDFFSTWLDKSLTYSCGIFNSSKETLEQAQINKYNKLINMVKPQKGDKVLEIGCGWGGFAEYMAQNYDVKLDCITISKKQYLFTKERIRLKGLDHKVNVKMLDYRKIKNKYDIIVSIEMIEAVGEKYLDKYFSIIKENLAPGGRGAIQAIVIKDELYNRYRKKEDFIQKYIFPGGFLPSVEYLKKLSNKSGLKIEEHYSYGSHYSNTLQKWRESFLNSWDKISKQGFNQSFKKMWDFYFAYCDAGFKSKNIDLVQLSLCNK